MPIAALHSLPAVLGPKRHAARFPLRASTATVSVNNGEVSSVVERKTTTRQDEAVAPQQDQRPGGLEALYDDGFGGVTVKNYFAAARAVSRDDGGPPRWFCPVECGRPVVEDAPLLLFLPGALIRKDYLLPQLQYLAYPPDVILLPLTSVLLDCTFRLNNCGKLSRCAHRKKVTLPLLWGEEN